MPTLRAALASVPPPEVQERDAEPWWNRLSALHSETSRPPTGGWDFRFGDALLQVASEAQIPMKELEDRYGDCAFSGTPSAHNPRVSCSVQMLESGRLALVQFAHPPAIDAFGVAEALLKHPVDKPLFSESATGQDGWRQMVSTQTGHTVLAACGPVALIDRQRVPSEFLVDFMVNPVLAIQRQLLFLHAASVGIGGAGILVIGPTGSGKTTTALTLGARGHAYYGDDMAAIRTATTELLVFRTTASVRPGPHARALSHHLESGQWDPPHADGVPRLRLRVAQVLPAADPAPLPLRRALFLRGFADAPGLVPFAPTPEALSPLALNNALWLAWGTTPQRRLLQFMLFVRLLARVRCAWLDVGPPEATADLIEQTMEE
ncbi:MAG TPA: hypothetical protein VLW55_12580 [Burkholderiaceae bacterium]|nr:hypothetical protein [Burkholderiaceae bacterium]